MKPDKQIINKIKSDFDALESYNDFLRLLNFVKPFIYGDKAKPFLARQIRWYINVDLNPNRYNSFLIRKKSGGDRRIHAPVRGLLAIQKTLAFILQTIFEPHPAAMGFTREKSIVDNARRHEGQRYVFNIDLKDFFPSIDQARVWKCLQLIPFNLIGEKKPITKFVTWKEFKEFISINDIGFVRKTDLEAALKGFTILKPITNDPTRFFKGKNRIWTETGIGNIYFTRNFDPTKEIFVLTGEKDLKSLISSSQKTAFWLVNKVPGSSRQDIGNTIAALCCVNLQVERMNKEGVLESGFRNVLPQGAPTSPVITNIVCQRLDFLLTGLAKRFSLRYSRYADDITFSSMHNVYQNEGDFLIELHRIIGDQGFRINDSKTRLQREEFRQEVTGLVVNQKANVQRRYVKRLRNWIYLWERYGYDKAYSLFINDYVGDKGHIKKGKPDMRNVIGGKLDFLRMVKEKNSELIKNLDHRFKKLCLSEDVKPPDKEGSELSTKRRPRINYVVAEENIEEMVMHEPKSTYTASSIRTVSGDDRKNHLSQVLEVLAEYGLNSAMKLYKIPKE